MEEEKDEAFCIKISTSHVIFYVADVIVVVVANMLGKKANRWKERKRELELEVESKRENKEKKW